MNKRFAFLRRLTTAAAISASLMGLPFAASAAEDVDIFGGKPGTGAPPNVLIVLDSSSNWSATLGPNSCNTGNMADNTKFAAEMCALQTVIPLLPARMRLGLMMFAETGTNGGYIRYAVRDMTDDNKKALSKMLSEFIPNGNDTDNSGSNQPYAKTLFEAWKYFGGGGTGLSPQGPTGFGPTAYAGGFSNNSGSKRRDHKNNNGDRAAPSYAGLDAQHAFAAQNSNTYQSPISESCTKNFVIFVSNGNPGTGGDTGADTIFTNIGGNPASASRIRAAGTEVHASLMDEFARHFFNNDLYPTIDGKQSLLTFTISVWQPQRVVAGVEIPSNTDSQMIKLMQSAADNAGGEHINATNAEAIKNALLKILNDVQAVNSVFVSASLPVSVNTQGTFLNQIYMGLFRPEPNPRWMGNVKQYKFIQDSSTGDIFLADANNTRAVNAATGFVSPAAVSFWTTPSDFWTRDEKGIPLSKSDSPDGDVVEKGGTAHVQRKALATAQTSRALYTCPEAGCGADSLLDFEFKPANITGASYQTAFNATTPEELSMIVNWVRGTDNAKGATFGPPLAIGQEPCDNTVAPCTWDSDEKGPGWKTTVRPSIQGDVLHSRPVVLNYCNDAAKCPNTKLSAVDGPYLFFGSNDGYLRAVKGGQGADDGKELWAFIAPEFFGKFRRLRYQDPTWLNPGTPIELAGIAQTKDYFFDGPIGSYEDPTTTPPTKWIFVGARRGGRVLYAFDVTHPEKPLFKWKVTNADLNRLGQTWSLPVAFKLAAEADPYLVFGAGYDPGEDATTPLDNGIGRGIYVLNARTGAQRAFLSSGITSPIASDIAFLAKVTASGGFGDVYRGYVGDLDGNVWRLDIEGTDATQWKVFKFASLAPGKKFLFAPDLVKAGNRDVILLGSGDREKPLVKDSVDHFFGMANFDNGVTALATPPAPLVLGDLTKLAGDAGIAATCATCKGWYREMSLGEKVVNSPLTVAGITYFSTNKPVESPPGNCQTNLGEARAYGLSFFTGAKPASKGSISTVLIGGGLPPSPVGGVVELEPGKLVTFVIGSGKDGSRLEPERPPLSVPTNRTKIYWNVKTDG